MRGRRFLSKKWCARTAWAAVLVGALWMPLWSACSDDSDGKGSDAGVDAEGIDASGPVCGNGVRETGEECDDGNLESGDGCDADCRSEYVCGNETLDPGEVCDGSEFSSSCALAGFLTGQMVCSDDCTLDESGCVETEAGIVAWYKMDTVSPLVPDATGQGHGCMPTAIQAGFPGRVAESSLFDRNQGAYADCGTGTGDATPMDGFEEMTLEAWVSMNTYPAIGDDLAAVFSRNATADPADQVYLLGVAGSAYGTQAYHAVFSVHSPDQAAIGSETLLTGHWYHLAATYRAGQLALYIDGTLDATATQDATGPVRSISDARTFIGAWNLAGDPHNLFDGYIDDIKVWSRVRSAEEICWDAGGWLDADQTCRFATE